MFVCTFCCHLFLDLENFHPSYVSYLFINIWLSILGGIDILDIGRAAPGLQLLSFPKEG